MEDPFLLHVMHLQDYFAKKIKELDEKARYYNTEVLDQKQEEMERFLEELENDLPPRPDDGISFKAIRSQKEQQPSDLARKSGSMTPKRLNSEILSAQDITQSTLFSRNEPTYLQSDKNVRHSDIISGQPRGLRSTSQQPHGVYGMGSGDPYYKSVTQSTIERTTIFLNEKK